MYSIAYDINEIYDVYDDSRRYINEGNATQEANNNNLIDHSSLLWKSSLLLDQIIYMMG